MQTREMMTLPIYMLVGSQSGNAAMVADVLGQRLRGRSLDVQQVSDSVAEAQSELLGDARVILVCCSTHGDGEVPDNLRDLEAALSACSRRLVDTHYGLVALGDRTYGERFCAGARRVEALLSRLGARSLGEALLVDASVQPFPDEAALEWLDTWLPAVESMHADRGA
jgi:MioC protein